jgi:hypothetical protein
MSPGRTLIVVFALALAVPASCAQTPNQAPQHPSSKEAIMNHASGPFDVKLAPQPTDTELGRMSIDKQFHGDLEATSKGEMLAAQTAVKGSAGYVAMEKVSGTLKGRKGTFILQHSATMNRGTPQLSITVVPDSGTGELTGLTGKMNIIIENGKHSYDFEYAIEDH